LTLRVGIVLRGTVVTMDDAGNILRCGNVLIRDGIIGHRRHQPGGSESNADLCGNRTDSAGCTERDGRRPPSDSALTGAEFRQLLTFYFELAPDRRLNIERIHLAAALVEDDDFYFHLLGGEVLPSSGLIAGDMPTFELYPANLNHVQPLSNPFDANKTHFVNELGGSVRKFFHGVCRVRV